MDSSHREGSSDSISSSSSNRPESTTNNTNAASVAAAEAVKKIMSTPEMSSLLQKLTTAAASSRPKPTGPIYTLFPLPSDKNQQVTPASSSLNPTTDHSKNPQNNITSSSTKKRPRSEVSTTVKKRGKHERSKSNASMNSDDTLSQHHLPISISSHLHHGDPSSSSSLVSREHTPSTPTTPQSTTSIMNNGTPILKFSKSEIIEAFTVSQTRLGYLLTYKHLVEVPLHPDDYKDKVVLAIVKSLLLNHNSPLSPRELAAFIQDHELASLSGTTPSSSISSRMSQHFKRAEYIRSLNDTSSSTQDNSNGTTPTAPTLSQSALNKLSSLDSYGLPLFRKTTSQSRGRKLLYSLIRFNPDTLDLSPEGAAMNIQCESSLDIVASVLSAPGPARSHSQDTRSTLPNHLLLGEGSSSSSGVQSDLFPMPSKAEMEQLLHMTFPSAGQDLLPDQIPLMMIDPSTGRMLNDAALEDAIAELVGDVSLQVEQVLLKSEVKFADPSPEDDEKQAQQQGQENNSSTPLTEKTSNLDPHLNQGTEPHGTQSISASSEAAPVIIAPQPIGPGEQLFPSVNNISQWKSPVISPNVNPIQMTGTPPAVDLPGPLLSAGKRLFSLDELDALLETEEMAPKRPFSTPPAPGLTFSRLMGTGASSSSPTGGGTSRRRSRHPPSLLGIGRPNVPVSNSHLEEREDDVSMVSSPQSDEMISPATEMDESSSKSDLLTPIRSLVMTRSQSVPVSSPNLKPTKAKVSALASSATPRGRTPTMNSTLSMRTPARKASKLHKRSNTLGTSNFALDSPAATAAASLNVPYPSSTTLFDHDVELFFEFDPSFSSSSGSNSSEDDDETMGDEDDDVDMEDDTSFLPADDEEGQEDSDTEEDITKTAAAIEGQGSRLSSESMSLLQLWDPTSLERYPLLEENSKMGPIWLVKVQDAFFYLTLFCFDTRTLLSFPYDPSVQNICGKKMKECIRFVPLLRRTDNGIVNASSLLYAAGVISESEQTIALSMERIKIRVKKRNVLYGTWLPAHRARAVAESCCLLPRLEAFLSDSIKPDMFQLTNPTGPVFISEEEPLVDEMTGKVDDDEEEEDADHDAEQDTGPSVLKTMNTTLKGKGPAFVSKPTIPRNTKSNENMATKPASMTTNQPPRTTQAAVLSSILSKLLASAKMNKSGNTSVSPSTGTSKIPTKAASNITGNQKESKSSVTPEVLANAQRILSALTTLQQQKNGSAVSHSSTKSLLASMSSKTGSGVKSSSSHSSITTKRQSVIKGVSKDTNSASSNTMNDMVSEIVASKKTTLKKTSKDTVPTSKASHHPTPPSTPQPTSNLTPQALSTLNLLNTLLSANKSKSSSKANDASSSITSSSTPSSKVKASGSKSSSRVPISTMSPKPSNVTPTSQQTQQLAAKLLAALKPAAGTSKEQWASIIQAATKSIQQQTGESATRVSSPVTATPGSSKIKAKTANLSNTATPSKNGVGKASTSSSKLQSTPTESLNPLAQKLLSMTGPLLQAYGVKQQTQQNTPSSANVRKSQSTPSTPLNRNRSPSSSTATTPSQPPQSKAQVNLLNNLMHLLAKAQKAPSSTSGSSNATTIKANKKELSGVSKKTSLSRPTNKKIGSLVASSQPEAVALTGSIDKNQTIKYLETLRQRASDNKSTSSGASSILSDLTSKLSASGIDLEALLGHAKAQAKSQQQRQDLPSTPQPSEPSKKMVEVFPPDDSMNISSSLFPSENNLSPATEPLNEVHSNVESVGEESMTPGSQAHVDVEDSEERTQNQENEEFDWEAVFGSSSSETPSSGELGSNAQTPVK